MKTTFPKLPCQRTSVNDQRLEDRWKTEAVFLLPDLAMELKVTAGDQFPEIMVIATATATGPCNSDSGYYS